MNAATKDSGCMAHNMAMVMPEEKKSTRSPLIILAIFFVAMFILGICFCYLREACAQKPQTVDESYLRGDREDPAAPLLDEKEQQADELRQQEIDAERARQAEAERLAEEERVRKEEEERLRKEEAEKLAEAERLRKEEEERLRKEEADKLAEAERLRKEEEERLRKEEAEKLAEAERLRKAEEERLRKEEAERLRKEEEERLRKEEADRLAAEEARKLKAEEEARLKREKEAKLKAEQEAAEEEKRKKEEAARLKAEADAAAAEEARRKQAELEAEAKRIADEKAAAEAARLKAEEEERKKREEEEAKKRAEEERLAKIEEGNAEYYEVLKQVGDLFGGGDSYDMEKVLQAYPTGYIIFEMEFKGTKHNKIPNTLTLEVLQDAFKDDEGVGDLKKAKYILEEVAQGIQDDKDDAAATEQRKAEEFAKFENACKDLLELFWLGHTVHATGEPAHLKDYCDYYPSTAAIAKKMLGTDTIPEMLSLQDLTGALSKDGEPDMGAVASYEAEFTAAQEKDEEAKANDPELQAQKAKEARSVEEFHEYLDMLVEMISMPDKNGGFEFREGDLLNVAGWKKKVGENGTDYLEAFCPDLKPLSSIGELKACFWDENKSTQECVEEIKAAVEQFQDPEIGLIPGGKDAKLTEGEDEEELESKVESTTLTYTAKTDIDQTE